MDMNGTILIDRPVKTVFAYVDNPENDIHWRSGATDSGWRSSDPPGVGSIGYIVIGGQEIEWRLVAYNPGESMDWVFLSGPLVGHGGYRLVPVEDGTHFTLVAVVKPSGVYKLLGPLFGRMVRRSTQADVEKLRDILEATAD